jgi:WD40 repeat protein
MDKLNPDAYTERELKLMTGRAHAGGGRTTVDHLLILCHGFKSQHGVFPSNSSELLAFLWQNDVQTGRRVHSMSLKDQFMEVGLLVNPVTGKFYESFASTEWVRGGVNFRELHLPSEIDAAFVNAFGWPSGQGLQVASDPNVIGVWSIELWGEKPGIKLGSRPVTTMMPSKDRVLVEKQQSEGQTHPH